MVAWLNTYTCTQESTCTHTHTHTHANSRHPHTFTGIVTHPSHGLLVLIQLLHQFHFCITVLVVQRWLVVCRPAGGANLTARTGWLVDRCASGARPADRTLIGCWSVLPDCVSRLGFAMGLDNCAAYTFGFIHCLGITAVTALRPNQCHPRSNLRPDLVATVFGKGADGILW